MQLFVRVHATYLDFPELQRIVQFILLGVAYKTCNVIQF